MNTYVLKNDQRSVYTANGVITDPRYNRVRRRFPLVNHDECSRTTMTGWKMAGNGSRETPCRDTGRSRKGGERNTIFQRGFRILEDDLGISQMQKGRRESWLRLRSKVLEEVEAWLAMWTEVGQVSAAEPILKLRRRNGCCFHLTTWWCI